MEKFEGKEIYLERSIYPSDLENIFRDHGENIELLEDDDLLLQAHLLVQDDVELADATYCYLYEIRTVCGTTYIIDDSEIVHEFN